MNKAISFVWFVIIKIPMLICYPFYKYYKWADMYIWR